MNGSEWSLESLSVALAAVAAHVEGAELRERLTALLERELGLALELAGLAGLPSDHPAVARVRYQRQNLWLTSAEAGALLLAIRRWLVVDNCDGFSP